VNRRNFVKTSCLICGGAITGIALFDSCKKSDPQGPTVDFTLDLSQSGNSVLNNSGGSLPSNGVIVVNSASTFIAIAQQCTHNGCSVGYNSNSNNFICPCHNGTFDINGNVTGGPPSIALKKYSVTKNGNLLTVKG
jgi:cytochrome b6-f complex iron-sulfur subunit